MVTPLAEWSTFIDFVRHRESPHPKLIDWYQFVHRYQVEIQKTGTQTADVCVFDHKRQGKFLGSLPIELQLGKYPSSTDLEIRGMVKHFIANRTWSLKLWTKTKNALGRTACFLGMHNSGSTGYGETRVACLRDHCCKFLD